MERMEINCAVCGSPITVDFTQNAAGARIVELESANADLAKRVAELEAERSAMKGVMAGCQDLASHHKQLRDDRSTDGHTRACSEGAVIAYMACVTSIRHALAPAEAQEEGEK